MTIIFQRVSIPESDEKINDLLFRFRMVLIDYTCSSIIHGKKKDLFNVSVIFL